MRSCEELENNCTEKVAIHTCVCCQVMCTSAAALTVRLLHLKRLSKFLCKPLGNSFLPVALHHILNGCYMAGYSGIFALERVKMLIPYTEKIPGLLFFHLQADRCCRNPRSWR